MVASVDTFLFGLTQLYFLLAVVTPTVRGGAPAPHHTFEQAPQVG